MDPQKQLRLLIVIVTVLVLVVLGWWFFAKKGKPAANITIPSEVQKSIEEVNAAKAPATTTTKKQVEEVKVAKPAASQADLQAQIDSVANTPSPFKN